MNSDIKDIIASLAITTLFGVLLFMGCMSCVYFLGCDSPPQQQRTEPTAVFFADFDWQLTDSTQHHCPQPWDTRIYTPGEIIVLKNSQTRFPFLLSSGKALSPTSERDSADTYAAYSIQWRGDGNWETIRVITVPRGMIGWVQLDGGLNDDLLRVVEP